MKFGKIINALIPIKRKNSKKYLNSIKNFLLTVSIGIGKKLTDFIYIFCVFVLLSSIYYVFTGINHSNFTYDQIEEFIKKDLPNDNFETLIYKKDLKGYGEDSLVILTKSNMDDLDKEPFSQKHMDKIYIFDKIQKGPLEKLLFGGDIYKKTYVIEFPIRCFNESEKDVEVSYGEDCFYDWLEDMDPGFYDYHYSKENHFILNTKFFKSDDRYNVVVSFYTPHGVVNPTDFGYYIISYDIKTGYQTLPLTHDFGRFTLDDRGEYDDFSFSSDYPQVGLYNRDYKMVINDKLTDIRLSSIDMNSGEIIFKDDNTFDLRVFNFDTCEGDGRGYPGICEFYEINYKFYEDVFYKNNDSNFPKYIETGTVDFNTYHNLGKQ